MIGSHVEKTKSNKTALCIYTVIPGDFTVLYSELFAELSHPRNIVLNGMVAEFSLFGRKGQKDIWVTKSCDSPQTTIKSLH